MIYRLGLKYLLIFIFLIFLSNTMSLFSLNINIFILKLIYWQSAYFFNLFKTMIFYFHCILSVSIFLIKPLIIVNDFLVIFNIITEPIRLCIVPIAWTSLPNAKILRAHPIEYVLWVYLWVRISNSCHWLEVFLFVNFRRNRFYNSIFFFGKINLVQLKWFCNYSVKVYFSSCLVWYTMIHNKVYNYRDWIFANMKSPHLVDYLKLRDVLALKDFLDEIV